MKNFLFIKVLVIFLAIFSISAGVSAQDEAFNKEDRVINLGVGLGSYIGWRGYSTKVPVIAGSFEYGVLDFLDDRAGIGLGGYLAYTSSGSKGVDKWSITDFIIGARALFHYQFIEKLDTYLGFMFGYDIVSYSQKDANLSGSKFISSQFIGARYCFANNFSFFGELGYGVAPLEIGISYKF